MSLTWNPLRPHSATPTARVVLSKAPTGRGSSLDLPSGTTSEADIPTTVVRRLTLFAAILGILAVSGLGLLLFRWSGERGATPAGRLYLGVDVAGLGLERQGFDGQSPLVTLDALPEEAECWIVRGPSVGTRAEPLQVCRHQPLHLWLGDARVELSLGARGVPRVSIDGSRSRPGDLLGSLADTQRPHPRVPLRSAGVPGVAATVVHCAPDMAVDGRPALCLEVHDTKGRLAVQRSAGHTVEHPVEVPAAGDRVALHSEDRLWLGLVPFAVTVEDADGTEPMLRLERIPRLRSGGGLLGGDRRWLGRLWHVEPSDAAIEPPNRYAIYPMKSRYTPRNLSRQRTNFEGEDVLQRLIDGQWLCLTTGGDVPQIDWRPLERPGCGPRGSAQSGLGQSGLGRSGLGRPALTQSAIADYRRARFGDLAFLANALVDMANGALTKGKHLEDATALPFVFDWGLTSLAQPTPVALWGVRFGATRQAHRPVARRDRLLPTVLPRDSTGRHTVQLLRDDRLAASYTVPSAVGQGSLCRGKHRAEGSATMPFRPTSGGHFPLGSVAFADDSNRGTWSSDADIDCLGCRLDLRPQLDATGTAELVVVESGDCALGSGGAAETRLAKGRPGQGSAAAAVAAAAQQEVRRLEHGESIPWGAYTLRYVDRGAEPWLTLTDPGTGRREFAEEMYVRGGLRPLLGDAAGLSGLEATLREDLADRGEQAPGEDRDHPATDPWQLSIDGDLQLAAAGIVDALGRDTVAPVDPDPDSVSVTAVVLDTLDGSLLAAVSWSTAGSQRGASLDVPTAWELGSGQAKGLDNAALLRRGAVGSTMKITGGYALVNSGGLEAGPEIDRRWRRRAFVEAVGLPGSRGQSTGLLFLADADRGASRRSCSTGPHHLPAGDAGFTDQTFVKRFAQSCNNFFVLTGLRHAAGRALAFHDPAVWPASHGERPAVDAGTMVLDLRQPSKPTLVLPGRRTESLADRLRQGLAADTVIPQSPYGILLGLGFQPRPSATFPPVGMAPDRLRFEYRDTWVEQPLVNDWFSPTGDRTSEGATDTPHTARRTPTLRPGRDYAPPSLPSPGRMDEHTVQGDAALEHYSLEGTPRAVRRHEDDGRADVQYAMLMIGQSHVELSALGLASLYAPAARPDGRAVSPCLFRDNCGPHRGGAPILNTQATGASVGAGAVNRALDAVLRPGGTAHGALYRLGLRDLADRGWGGKTGTFQVERSRWPHLDRDRWQHLRQWACGVEGVQAPRLPQAKNTEGRGVLRLARRLAEAPRGSALGARSCEGHRTPLNPSAVQRYGDPAQAAALDRLAEELERTAVRESPAIHHSFVAVATPSRPTHDGAWVPSFESPAQGLVVAVIVDRETPKNPSIAVQIGAELAAAAERWALLAGRTASQTPSPSRAGDGFPLGDSIPLGDSVHLGDSAP